MAGPRPVPTEPAQARQARAGDKDNTNKTRQLQKKKEINKPNHQGDINCGPHEERKELSVCLFGLPLLRNNYSLLITIWRKERRRSGLAGLRSGEAGAELPRLQRAAPEDSPCNVITFCTPPSQRIKYFDPSASALWPTWVALWCFNHKLRRRRRRRTDG